MQAAKRPRLVIAILVVVFLIMLGIALYAPAFVASSSSSPGSSVLTVTPISYLHSNNNLNFTTSGAITPANYTGLFYVQHVCVYHQ
jgi:flagellar basal body-associated protein FliL